MRCCTRALRSLSSIILLYPSHNINLIKSSSISSWVRQKHYPQGNYPRSYNQVFPSFTESRLFTFLPFTSTPLLPRSLPPTLPIFLLPTFGTQMFGCLGCSYGWSSLISLCSLKSRIRFPPFDCRSKKHRIPLPSCSIVRNATRQI